jgi:hypothetical protein
MIGVIRATALGICLVVIGTSSATGQNLTKQIRDSDVPISMSSSELSELGDPFFLLVLKDHINTFSLDEIEKLIQPDESKRQLFVVSERAGDLNSSSAFRAVLAFQGSVGGIALSPNVMLSVVFTKDAFPTDSTTGLRFIEALGWDDSRGRFNYYKLDRASGAFAWKFRGSSNDVDQLTDIQRTGTCFSCHLNGGPVMKELLVPWNHWHSEEFRLRQLDPFGSPSVRWPVATLPRFRGSVGGGGGLQSASQLDPQIRSSIKTFVQAKVQRNLETVSGGRRRVKNAPALLKSLFVMTEFNIISSRVQSNGHPLSASTFGQPAMPVSIPASFFLNADFISGGGLPGFKGLGIAEATNFPGLGITNVMPQEYAKLVQSRGLKVDDKSGDAVFSWLVPEPSNFDNQMCDVMVRRGIIPGQFAAAVQSIDLRTPVLSSKRAGLLRFIPLEYEIDAVNPSDPLDITFFTNHALTKHVITSIEAISPTVGSVESEFLALLRQGSGFSPVQVLKNQIDGYAVELKTELGNSVTREATLQKLFERLLDTRKRVLSDAKLGKLDETGGKLLFPTP